MTSIISIKYKNNVIDGIALDPDIFPWVEPYTGEQNKGNVLFVLDDKTTYVNRYR